MLLDVGGVNVNEAEPLIRLGNTHACTVGVVRLITKRVVVVVLVVVLVVVVVVLVVVVGAGAAEARTGTT